MGCKRKLVANGESGKERISYLSIRLSHTLVEMNKMCLNSISVVISLRNIIFEIEHYECKSRMMHPNEADVCRCVGLQLLSF